MNIHLGVLLLCVLTVFWQSSSQARNGMSIRNLKCDDRVNPLGIEMNKPRLSWQLHSSLRNRMQSAYQILVSDSPLNLTAGVGNLWDSGKKLSSNSIQVPYDGRPLVAGKRYFWKVKVWDQSGAPSEWSEMAYWHMGLLRSSDWSNAAWIGFETLPDSLKVIPGVHGAGDDLENRGIRRPIIPIFRKEFEARKEIGQAILYICGLGQYEASINGKKVYDSFLAPGWTYYPKTCLYNVYDVTDAMSLGHNTLGVMLGTGFYNINRERYRKLVVAFGMPKLVAKLHIEYADGTDDTFVSGSDWKCAASPITFTSIYGGEDYDARLEREGWDRPGFDDSGWKGALLVEPPGGRLTAQTDFPIAVEERLSAKMVTRIDSTRYLYDFGQNASGIVELKITGRKGQSVKLIPGELIHTDGTINQHASGEPYYFTYVLKGDGVELWKPRFTYYGFRYVMVEGVDSAATGSMLPHLEDLTFLHTRNSSPQAGTFSCSNPLFNRVFGLINWAIKSNLQSVVTDCPHREKLGWLEQTHLMGASLHYNFALHQLYRKAVHDMIDAQTSSGLLPDIAPEYVQFLEGFRDSPEWGSASVILPWMLYRWYGDRETLDLAWPLMTNYVAYLGTQANGDILSYGLGDWCDLGPNFPGKAQLTPTSLTASASYYYDIVLLARMAKILGHNPDAKRLTALGARVKRAFNKKFFNEATRVYSTGSQTAMAMPLCVGLVEERFRNEVMKNLVDSIANAKYALTAGDVGFHYLIQALQEGGASDVIFRINERSDVPGYGYQLKKGATALTESWPALEEVSNNHLMLGHIMEWFYAGLAGIGQDPKSVAFKKIVIHPTPVGDIREASASYDSPYGLIKSLWTRRDGMFELSVEIPVNTTATVVLPTADPRSITEAGRSLEKGFMVKRIGEYETSISIHSGSYVFRSR